MYFQQTFNAESGKSIQALQNWQYEYPPGPCRFQVAIKYKVTGGPTSETLGFDVYSGSDLVVQNGSIPEASSQLAPNALEDFNINGAVAPPERLGILLRPTFSGGTSPTMEILVAVKLIPVRA